MLLSRSKGTPGQYRHPDSPPAFSLNALHLNGCMAFFAPFCRGAMYASVGHFRALLPTLLPTSGSPAEGKMQANPAAGSRACHFRPQEPRKAASTLPQARTPARARNALQAPQTPRNGISSSSRSSRPAAGTYLTIVENIVDNSARFFHKIPSLLMPFPGALYAPAETHTQPPTPATAALLRVRIAIRRVSRPPAAPAGPRFGQRKRAGPRGPAPWRLTLTPLAHPPFRSSAAGWRPAFRTSRHTCHWQAPGCPAPRRWPWARPSYGPQGA